jgi:hypothetical protein
MHENIKKRAYDQRIREVEHGTFSPLVFSCTGGMSRAAVSTYKRLAALIAAKRDESYSTTMGWIRCRLSFSLLRSAIMCLRGTRSVVGRAAQPDAPINLVSSLPHKFYWVASRGACSMYTSNGFMISKKTECI